MVSRCMGDMRRKAANKTLVSENDYDWWWFGVIRAPIGEVVEIDSLSIIFGTRPKMVERIDFLELDNGSSDLPQTTTNLNHFC